MQKQYVKYNHVHGPKQQLLGNPAQQVPPAWRTNMPSSALNGSAKGKEIPGSKIFISGLPFDVGEKEIEELFKKTVGPLRESFMVYNSQGKSKGMAIVVFQRPGDAAVAQKKYHGKIVDARRPIRIEIMVDYTPSGTTTTTSTLAPSLLSRIEHSPADTISPVAPKRKSTTSAPSAPIAQRVKPVKSLALPPRRLVRRKGPKRLKKRLTTVEDLDKEMDEYRAAAPENPFP